MIFSTQILVPDKELKTTKTMETLLDLAGATLDSLPWETFRTPDSTLVFPTANTATSSMTAHRRSLSAVATLRSQLMTLKMLWLLSVLDVKQTKLSHLELDISIRKKIA